MKLIGELTGRMLASGVYKDLPNKEPPLWADGKNIYFSDNSVQPIPAQYLLTSSLTGVPIKGIKASVIGGEKTLFYGTYDKLFKYTRDGGAAEVGSGYTNTSPNTNNLWSFARWSDWMLATNNKDTPQIYKGTNFQPLAGIGSQFSKGRFFIAYGEYMILVDGPLIFWCHRSNVEDWVPVATNSAGSLSPQDLDGDFMGGEILGTTVFLFTLNSMHRMEYIGPPNYFGIFKVEKSPGVFGISSLTVHDKKIFGLGPGGAFVTDGDGHVYIDEGVVHDDIFSDLSEDNTEKSLVWHSKFTKQICFWWPGRDSAENNRSHGFNYINNTWAPRGDERTAAEESGIFPWGILADDSGGIFAENTVGDPVSIQDGHLIVSGAGTYAIPFGMSGFGQGGFGGNANFTE